MSTNVFFSNGTRNEQYLIEDLIIESLRIYGQEMVYIPRQLVSKDDILGEDRLSEFKQTFPIEAYFENVDSFDGQGAFLQKFGLMMEQSATLVIARRRWEQLIGRFESTILPNRPCEGDLMYFPLTGGLFEIKFVKHQDPFYQLGKLYVYKLQVELFQYSSERIDTGVDEIDVFESLKTMDIDPTVSNYGMIKGFNILNNGSNYTTASINITSNTGTGALAEAVIEDGMIVDINLIEGGVGYKDACAKVIGDGTGAIVELLAGTDIDKVDSYGDNNSFIKQSKGLVFDPNNPFNE